MTDCSCHSSICHCRSAIPITTNSSGIVEKCQVRQKKGEAEMAQIDWLMEFESSLEPDECVVSVVSSGGIDAVVLHLYILTYLWTSSNHVYVMLQKPGGSVDMYNITKFIRVLQTKFNDPLIGAKVAITLCIGGNDFIPKFYGMSHDKYLTTMLTDNFRDRLFILKNDRLRLSESVFVDYVQALFCPKALKSSQRTFEEVQEATREMTRRSKPNLHDIFDSTVRDARQWLPPKSAVLKLAELVNLQIDYMDLAGSNDAVMSTIKSASCFKAEDREVEFNFGPDCHITSFQNIV